MGMRPICDHIQNIFLCGIHIQANKLKTGNHNLFHRSFRQGQSAVQPFMLIFLQHPALVAFIQQHINLLLGVDVLMAAGWEPERVCGNKPLPLRKSMNHAKETVSIAWDNKYTRPPAWETEEPGIWASILQDYLKNRQAYQYNRAAANWPLPESIPPNRSNRGNR